MNEDAQVSMLMYQISRRAVTSCYTTTDEMHDSPKKAAIPFVERIEKQKMPHVQTKQCTVYATTIVYLQ